MENNNTLNQAELEILSNRIETIEQTQKQMIIEQEDKIEMLEKQIANLIMGYAEASTLIETLVAVVLYDGDEDKQKRFHRIVNDNKAKMFKIIQDAGKI